LDEVTAALYFVWQQATVKDQIEWMFPKPSKVYIQSRKRNWKFFMAKDAEA
jgi:hypothetical protein